MNSKKLLSLVLLLAMATIPLGCLTDQKKSKTEPFPAKVTLKSKRPGVGGFYVNDPGGFDSLPSLKTHSTLLDEIHPLWYHVRPDGSLKEESVAEATTYAHQHKIKVIPLVNVVPSKDNVLVDPTAMSNTIANLVRVVKANNYDGVNIDFEFIPNTTKKDFSTDRGPMTQFMKLIHAEMKKLNKSTEMCVLPHIGVPSEMSGIYDYSKLAPYVDKVTVMCYDHSQEGSTPRPLAPFAWVEQNISLALKQGFKPSQLFLGVATYGYNWPAGKSGGFSDPSKQILQRASMKGYSARWSAKYQEPYYVFTGPNGEQREIWFENHQTLQTKINLVNKYKLAGLNIWRLGFEDAQFWQIIAKNFGTKK